MTNIKERVLQISDYYVITKEKFFSDLGLSYANFKGSQKKTSLSSDAIDKILSNYPDISVNWLVLGKGEMIAEKANTNAEVAKSPENLDVYMELITMQKKEIARLEKEIADLVSKPK